MSELDALRDRVAALAGCPCHVGQVPSTVAPPYASVSSPAWGDPDDLPLNGPDATLDVPVLLTLTDTTEGNVHTRLRRVRDGLVAPAPLVVEGRHVVAVWERSEGNARTDRDITYGSTNRHPVVGNATIRVVSQPS